MKEEVALELDLEGHVKSTRWQQEREGRPAQSCGPCGAALEGLQMNPV